MFESFSFAYCDNCSAYYDNCSADCANCVDPLRSLFAIFVPNPALSLCLQSDVMLFTKAQHLLKAFVVEVLIKICK
ncbi:MAG: hypothetical protein BWY75_00717 [bacterium ADurb.Bin425]|nr:MAG: hypothetical protein BWY75_00717 [bacterium ADurb.Bin425]